MFLSFSYVRKQTKHQRQNSLLADLVFLREDVLFSLFPGKLPIFLILLSRTLYLREVCVKFSRSVVSASWWCQRNRQPCTGLPAERRTPLFFLISSRSFSVSFLGLVCCFCNRFEVVNGRTFIKICQ